MMQRVEMSFMADVGVCVVSPDNDFIDKQVSSFLREARRWANAALLAGNLKSSQKEAVFGSEASAVNNRPLQLAVDALYGGIAAEIIRKRTDDDCLVVNEDVFLRCQLARHIDDRCTVDVDGATLDVTSDQLWLPVPKVSERPETSEAV